MFDLIKPSDSPAENIYAPAYIVPEYDQLAGFKNNNCPFALNSPETDGDLLGLDQQLNTGRNTVGFEGDDFWVVYIQFAYQGPEDKDSDGIIGITYEGALAGRTQGDAGTVSDFWGVEGGVKKGGYGSLVYLEGLREMNINLGCDFGRQVVPHVIGHQFGLRGDPIPDADFDWGIMDVNCGPAFFHSEQLNLLRWRIKSPGN